MAETWTDRFERWWSPVIAPMGRYLIARMPIRRARRVLDVGTGGGQLLPAIRERAPRAAIAGIDLNADGLAIAARSRLAALARMDAQRPAFADATFDAALAVFMLFQVPEPDRVLFALARILEPAGVVGTVTWGERNDMPDASVWEEELDAAGAKPIEGKPGSDETVNTPEKTQALLERSGFEVRRCWMRRFRRVFSTEELVAIRRGLHSRLRALDGRTQEAVVERVCRRLEATGPAGVTYTPEVVFAIARRV